MLLITFKHPFPYIPLHDRHGTNEGPIAAAWVDQPEDEIHSAITHGKTVVLIVEAVIVNYHPGGTGSGRLTPACRLIVASDLIASITTATLSPAMPPL